jgi:hypothetical protein
LCCAENRLLGEIGGECEINGTAAVERLSDEALGLEDDVLRCDDARAQTTGSVI